MTLAIRHTLHGVLALGVLVVLGWVIARGQWVALGGLMAAPIALFYLMVLMRQPIVGVYSLILISFFIGGINRYVPGAFGLLIDGLLVLTLLAEFFKRFHASSWPYLAGNRLLWFVYAWVGYCVFELINPEARSWEAWFYAGRGITFYVLVLLWLGLEIFNQPRHLERLLKIWLGISVAGAVVAIKQIHFFLDPFEEAWLSEEAARTTHIVQGQLRAFSFYSDAGQFGAAMGHAGLVSLILALGPFSRKQRWFYGISAALCLYGLALSGTRGALFVPVAGLAMYLLLVRSFPMIIVGGLVAGLFLGMLKFTYIGQGNYQIQRMRSALDPQDASLQLRLENQAKLREYLKTRPFGGGIGTAGYWGKRFSPNSFLANLGIDSWYVKIAAETGIVGLTLHLLMIGSWLVVFFRRLWLMPPGPKQTKLQALYAGLFGIAVASYGNQILGQMPTGVIIYFSVTFLYVLTHSPNETAISLQPAAPDGTHHRR
jgi:hypothetical protein